MVRPLTKTLCVFPKLGNVFKLTINFNLEGFDDVCDDLVEHPVALAEYHAHVDVLQKMD